MTNQKPDKGPASPPPEDQTAKQGDDVIDDIEQEAADKNPPPPPANDDGVYRKALDGFDPHLRDARALTLEGGVRIMRDLFPFQKPLFRADGNIPANIGRYRIAKDDSGHSALLFAFDPDDLKEDDLSVDHPAGRLGRIHVVQARKDESPAHWAYPEIIRHQHLLQERALTNYTLYQTSADVWRSDQVGYVLYPVEEQAVGGEAGRGNNGKDKDKKAEQQFTLWMFSNTHNSGEFTEVSTKPPANLLEAGMTLGSKIGTFNRQDAVRKIQEDFATRLRREATGDDPVSLIEKGKNPIWLPTRLLQKARKYFKENKPAAIALDALIATVNVIDGPVGLIKGQLLNAVGSIRNSYSENTKPLDVTDQLAKNKRTAPGFDALLRDVDQEALKSYHLTNAHESEAVPVGEEVIEEIHERFSQRRLLGAMVGSDGAIARIRQNGIVSLRHANGVKVDHAPDGETTYVRYDPSAAVPEARMLRSREAALFKGDRVLKMTGIGNNAAVEPISGEQFLSEIKVIQTIHDEKMAEEAAEQEKKTLGRDSGIRAEWHVSGGKPNLRWRNRLKAAADKAISEGEAATAAAEEAQTPHPSSKTPTADAANDGSDKSVEKRKDEPPANRARKPR